MHEVNDSQRRLKVLGGVLSTIGALIVLGAGVLVLVTSWGYFLSSSRLPTGAGVRPMGVTFLYFMAGITAMVAGLPLSALGAVLSDKAQFRAGVVLGMAGARLSSIPLMLGPVLMLLSDQIIGVEQAQ
jgi:hypothetical protein